MSDELRSIVVDFSFGFNNIPVVESPEGPLDVATLMAGDFFGEMALLRGEPRTATCRAVTACALYELKRSEFDAVRKACPGLQAAIEDVEKRRRAELEGATRPA